MRTRSRSFATIFAFLFSIFAVPAQAQTTQVTGTVSDANGIAYSGARVTAQLVFAGTPVSNPTVTISVLAQCKANGFGSAPCQVPFSPNQGPFFLDSGGNVPGGGITLQDNSLVQPGSTQWLITVNENGTPPPVGTGPQICNAQLTITGGSQSISGNFSCPAISRVITTLPNLTVSSLTPGNCVQAAAGGQLVTIGGPCGSSAGFVTVTGTPSIGNLSCFSGATSITNCLLSGDVSTSGSGVTTLATVATPGTNTKITFNAKGLVTAGAQAQLASADYANQGSATTVLHGNVAGNPSFGPVVSNDLNITPTTCTNQFLTALSSSAAGTCTPATLASAQFANQGTVHGILHGNAAGNPSFGPVDLTSEVSNTLPAAQMSQVNLAASGNGGVGGTLPGANMSQVNLAATGNGGAGGTLPGGNMSQVNLAATGNGGVGGTLPSADLGASSSNCAGNNFAQGWNSGGTPICGSPAAGGVTESTFGWGLVQQTMAATASFVCGGAGGAGTSAFCIDTVFAKSHTLVRLTYFLVTSPAGCPSQPTVGVRDDTAASTLTSLTIANGQATGFVDSGALSVATTAGNKIGVGQIVVAGVGCSTSAVVSGLTAVFQ
jgi:hypothetical protein